MLVLLKLRQNRFCFKKKKTAIRGFKSSTPVFSKRKKKSLFPHKMSVLITNPSGGGNLRVPHIGRGPGGLARVDARVGP